MNIVILLLNEGKNTRFTECIINILPQGIQLLLVKN